MIVNDEVKQFFNNTANEYDSYRNRVYLKKSIKKIEKILIKFNLLNKERILDLGVGTGSLLNYLIKNYNYKTIYGIDISEEMIKISRKKIQNGILKVSSAEEIPFDENFFDLLICIDVLEHVKDPIKVIQEITRVLKNGGIAILSTPNPFWAPIMYLAEKLKLKVKEGDHKFIFLNSLINKQKDIEVLEFGNIVSFPFNFIPNNIEEFTSSSKILSKFGFGQLVIIQKK